MWLKLTNINHNDEIIGDVWVNFINVTMIRINHQKKTDICFSTGALSMVMETPEQIMEMISRAKEA